MKIKLYKKPSGKLLEKIKDLHNECFVMSQWSDEYLKKIFSKQQFSPVLFVAEDAKFIGGFLIGRLAKEKNEFLVHSFLVKNELRGNGYGKKMMLETLSYVVKYTKAEDLVVCFRQSNPVSKFYELFGFSNSQEFGFYKSGEKKICMKMKIRKK